MKRCLSSVLFLTLFAVFAVPAQAAMNVTLAWDPNVESDLAGYRLHWGTSPGGPYPSMQEIPLTMGGFVPSAPEYTITGLADHTRYYFVATAYDTEALESGFSNEVNACSDDGVPPSSPQMLRILRWILGTLLKELDALGVKDIEVGG